MGAGESSDPAAEGLGQEHEGAEGPDRRETSARGQPASGPGPQGPELSFTVAEGEQRRGKRTVASKTGDDLLL